MAPIWDPSEETSNIYQEVENHSAGMISFTYRPLAQQEVDSLRNTATYRLLTQRTKARSALINISSCDDVIASLFGPETAK